MVISHKIVLRRHRLRTPRARSQGLLGSGLEEDHQHVRTARGDREGGERRTTAAPAQCRGGVAVNGAREVSEWSERRNLAGAERGDSLTLNYSCMDESGEHESESRRPQQNHGRRCEVLTGHALVYMRERIWASSGYHSFRLPEKMKSRGGGSEYGE